MNFQYISDQSGNKTAVVILISIQENIPEKQKKIDFENDFDKLQNFQKIDFENWINDAEKSVEMTFEEYNAKWKLKRQSIQDLIR